MQLTTVARVQVPRPPEVVFDDANDEARFSQLMQKRGPIPGVVRVEPVEGIRRRVFMTDGSEILEDVFEKTKPTRLRYRWASRPKPPFSWLIADAEATWTFSPKNGGTEVEWVYLFTLTSVLAYPAAKPVLALFRGWMQAALDRL